MASGSSSLCGPRALALAVGVCLATVLVPLLGTLAADRMIPDWRWSYEPLHIVAEGLGGFIAILLAVLILLMRRLDTRESQLVLLACGFLGMGILDLFHASTVPGHCAIWLHSAGGLIAGMFVALVWTRERDLARWVETSLPVGLALFSVALGVTGVCEPLFDPLMIEEKRFTNVAGVMNVAAGTGFLIGSLRFWYSYVSGRQAEDAFLGGLCLFLATAGFIFPFSSLWDASWWMWHFLRLLAFASALGYLSVLFVRNRRFVEKMSDLLHQRVTEAERLRSELSDQLGRLEDAQCVAEQQAAALRTTRAAFVDASSDLQNAITHRQYAELQLKASEGLLQSISDSATEAIIVADPRQKIISWNRGAESMFGYNQTEILGQSVECLIPVRYLRAHNRAFARATRTGKHQLVGKTVEMESVRKNGEVFPVELSLSVCKSWNGNAYCAILRDITERRRAEHERVRLLDAEHQLELAEREMHIAHAVQQSLFPPQPPGLRGFDIAGAVYPARDASGDCYDFLHMNDNELGLVIADVSGHGMGAALLMARTQAHLQALVHAKLGVNRILTHMNRLLEPDQIGRFVTMMFARLDLAEHRLEYASAGHRGYLLNADGTIHRLNATGVPLGIMVDSVVPAKSVRPLKPGDIILLPTDGFLEIQSPEKELFRETRVMEFVHSHRDRPAADIIHGLYHAARDFSRGAPQADDMSAVLVKVLDTD